MIPTRPGELELVIATNADDDGCEGHDPQRDLDRLERLVHSWPARACVRRADSEPDLAYDTSKPDFLPELLPFHDHPTFLRAPEPYRQAALSCGWLAYNEKTVAIESKVVSPACMHLIDGDVAGFQRHRYSQAVSQALVDESYHILLVLHANGVTRRERGLSELHIPSFELVTHMRRHQEKFAERWQKILIQLASAVVSEVLVSDYLRLLSNADDIQPLNRITTEIHRRDESAHNGLFKSLGAIIYHGLSPREKEFFVRALAEPSIWFASPELDVWEAMLRQIDFPGAERMIRDCRARRGDRGIRLDLSTLETLFADLGVENRLWSILEG
jgi:alpha-N-dichloroacetyl-p-aminophenylserinol N-oxygenase